MNSGDEKHLETLEKAIRISLTPGLYTNDDKIFATNYLLVAILKTLTLMASILENQITVIGGRDE